MLSDVCDLSSTRMDGGMACLIMVENKGVRGM